MLQGRTVTGLAGFGQIAFIDQLLFCSGACALGEVLNNPLCQGRGGISFQCGPDVDLANAVIEQLADLVIGDRRGTVQANAGTDLGLNCTGSVVVIVQVLAGCTMLRTQIGDYDVNTGFLHVALALVGIGDLTASFTGGIHDLVAGAFNQQLVAFALYVLPGLADVFFHRQGRGVVHNGRVHTQIAFQQICVGVMLSVIQMDENVHVGECFSQNVNAGPEQLQTDVPATGVGVENGLAGGLYIGQVLIYGSTEVGYLQDNTLVARGNREIFISDQCVLDASHSYCALIDEPLSVQGTLDFKAFISGAGWIEPATPGTGLLIKKLPEGRVSIGSQHIKHCKANGVEVQDSTTYVRVSSTTYLIGNGGWGFYVQRNSDKIDNQAMMIANGKN